MTLTRNPNVGHKTNFTAAAVSATARPGAANVVGVVIVDLVHEPARPTYGYHLGGPILVVIF